MKVALETSKHPPAARALRLAALVVSILMLSSTAARACSNDVLRSELHAGQLPNCRAYELVTPPYKEGTFITNAFAVSEDGEHVIGASLGVFAGAEGGEIPISSRLGAIAYEFSRSSTGWTSASLVPPASLYTGEGLRDVSADFGSSLWLLKRLSQPEGVLDLYLEKPRDTFTEIGPATPSPTLVNKGKFSYIGASADLSHVLFSTEREDASMRWPFDATSPDASTLYEYNGTGVEHPSLVGVNDNGALISRCGTRLGSSTPEEGNGSMYNAISATGERVFFTSVGRDDHECLGGEPSVEPPVDELLVREELPSGESRTLPISEESLLHCTEVPSIPCADANFEGAALDGSSVFFTSTQKLVEGASEDPAGGDSASVGGCSQTLEAGGCNLYEYDFGPVGHGLSLVSHGAGEPEGAQVQGVARISKDGTHVYFVARGVLTSTTNALGQGARVGADNLYLSVRECPGGESACGAPTSRIVFIATLSPLDGEDWARNDARPMLVSRDNRFLVFTSHADLTEEGTRPGINQVYRYDALSNGLARVSIGQYGYNDNGREPVYGSALPIARLPYSNFTDDSNYASVDSPVAINSTLAPANGAVIFQSADSLAPGALPDATDQINPQHAPIPNIYEYRDGNVYLIPNGQDTSVINGGPTVNLIGTSASGQDVFFSTSNSLVPQDTDTQQDIYDVRIDGGFSAPLVSPPCSGEACRGPLSQEPALGLPGSATQAAEASVSQPTLLVAKSQQKAKIKTKKKKKKKKKNARGKRARRTALGDHARRAAR